MTTEEAIKDIKENIKPCCGGISLDMAIEVLEKQIPKVLVCIEDKFLHCPCCNEALAYKWEKYPTEKTCLNWLKFCWNCGQAIKYE